MSPFNAHADGRPYSEICTSHYSVLSTVVRVDMIERAGSISFCQRRGYTIL